VAQGAARPCELQNCRHARRQQVRPQVCMRLPVSFRCLFAVLSPACYGYNIVHEVCFSSPGSRLHMLPWNCFAPSVPSDFGV